VGQEAGAKLDKAVRSSLLISNNSNLPRLNHTCADHSSQWADADREASKLKSNAESYAKDAKAETLKAIDKFDQKVEDGAAKAKSGISGWFGGSSK
jgi:hypothetical protein